MVFVTLPSLTFVYIDMDVYPLLPSFQQGFLTTFLGLLLYALVRVIYNVYFHPLSRFPSPRGAACTKWWLAYMQLGRGVSLSTLRVELHQKHGTVTSPGRSFDGNIDVG
jgi:hypothetical protein